MPAESSSSSQADRPSGSKRTRRQSRAEGQSGSTASTAPSGETPDQSSPLVVYVETQRTAADTLFVTGSPTVGVWDPGNAFTEPKTLASLREWLINHPTKTDQEGREVFPRYPPPGMPPAYRSVWKQGATDDQVQRVVTGVLPYGLLRVHLPADSRYITFLRDPVDRVLSGYLSLIRTGGTEPRYAPTREGPRLLPPPAPETSLEQMLEEGVYLLDNLATRMLYGGETPFGELPPDALERAKRNLREEFEFVGLSERLEESIVLLHRTLGPGGAVHPRRKAGVRPQAGGAQRPIEKHNRLDLELYAFALELCEPRLDALEDGRPRARRRKPGPESIDYGKAADVERQVDDVVTGPALELEPRFPAVPKEKGATETIEMLDRREGAHRSAGLSGRDDAVQRIRLGDRPSPAEIRFFGYPEGDLAKLREAVSPLDVRADTPPVYHFRNVVAWAGADCFYDERGHRILESCRPRGTDPCDIRCSSPDTIAVPADAPLISRPLIYCGRFSRHWGVFLTESINRLWALFHADLPQDAGLVGFKMDLGQQARGAKARARMSSGSFAREFLHHTGLAADRFIELGPRKSRPTRISDVFVPHPSFIINSQAFRCHFTVAEQVARAIDVPAQTDQPVYLSRSQLTEHKQRYFGEEDLDAVLRRAGVEVVHPERLSFEEQVRLVNRHRVFIGNVGSAFHTLMYVLPERRVQTFVIENTLNDHIANYVMIDLLKNVEANYLYVEALDRAQRRREDRRAALEPRPYGRLDVDAVESSLKALSVI